MFFDSLADRSKPTSSCLVNTRSQRNSNPHTSLDDANLARLQENHTKFGLDVEIALLSADEKVAISVTESSLLHGCIDSIDIQSHAFA
jgi:hypothetical protein